jgi:hypothetical protein
MHQWPLATLWSPHLPKHTARGRIGQSAASMSVMQEASPETGEGGVLSLQCYTNLETAGAVKGETDISEIH